MFLRVLFLLVPIFITPHISSAQTAAGFPSFTEGPFIATVGAGFNDEGNSFGAGFLGGSDDLFGGIGLGFSRVSDLDTNAFAVSGTVGSNFALDSAERIFLAPMGAVAFISGPDLGEVDVTIFGVRGGGRLGIVASAGGAVDVIPTFGLDVAWDRVSAEAFGVSTSASDTYAVASIGAGFRFGARVAVVPQVTMPIGSERSDITFAVSLGFSLGTR